MADIEIRDLGESDWRTYRELRLAALQESPEAFTGTFDHESQQDEDSWRDRIRRAHRFVAESNGKALGVVGLGNHGDDGDEAEAGEIFDLWVAPEARAANVARSLVAAAGERAAAQGRTHLFFWVVPDNVPAVAFATSFGFHPTSRRRPIAESSAEESALVISLIDDPTTVTNPSIPWLS